MPCTPGQAGERGGDTPHRRLSCGEDLFFRFRARFDRALNVENVLDELIFVNGAVGSSLEVASPRALVLRLGYRLR